MCGESWWGGGVNISVFLGCASTLLTGLGLCLCGRLGLGVLSVEKKKSGRVDLVSRSLSLSELSHRCAGYFGVGLRVIFNSNKDSCQHLLEAAVYSCGCLAFASLV